MTEDTTVRAKTGVPGLDRVLRGGLPRHNLYLVCGPSGAGKTTLALQYLMEGARSGERSLYIGTSETEEEIRAVAKSHGWDLSGVELRHHGGATEAPVRGLEQTMLHPVEVELPRTMEQLMSIVEEMKPDRLVIDSLSEIRILSREESWFRKQVRVLHQYIADQQATVVVTDLELDPASVLRSGVHGVIELEQIPTLYGPDRRRLRAVKVRGVPHATGYHAMRIETGGINVYPRLVAAEHRRRRRLETISSGIPELDSLLGGGLDRGTAMLIVGPTGTGKSSLATHLAVSLARRGEKSTMYIFDERVQTLFARSAGLGLELASHVETGLIRVQQIDPVEMTPGQLNESVVEAVEDGAKMVVLDSLNGYVDAMPDEGLLGVYLHELMSYLDQEGVISVHVMTQPGVLGQEPTHLNVSYIADTVVLLRHVELEGAMRKAISVHKRRIGAHERAARELVLSAGEIAVGEPLDDLSDVPGARRRVRGDPRPQEGGDS